MELSELKNKICDSFQGESERLRRILELVEDDYSVFPFNDYEHLICRLIDNGGLTFQRYLDIRNEYISENPNLWLFEISAPRGFGEKFAQTYILGLCHEAQKANNKIDQNYSGEYDLWLDGIKIEVKASRAVDSNSDDPLYMKALSRNTKHEFIMNFQQLKPQLCDVFVWVAVFRDEIVIWVLSRDEVVNSPLYSKGQHRGNSGNEGQIHVKNDNIHFFKKYELGNNKLEEYIRCAYGRKL